MPVIDRFVGLWVSKGCVGGFVFRRNIKVVYVCTVSVRMFEWILAGFTGSFFSYFVAFEMGAFLQSCATGPAKAQLDRIERKVEGMESRRFR